jgi:mRNA interferase MazF
LTQFVPDRGDLIWLTFDQQTGREQAGRRPALVLSPKSYNQKTGLAILCPITSQVKGYPFEVLLPAGLVVSGAILADHLKSVDWQVRQAKKAAKVPASLVADVLSRLSALLFA